MMSIHKNKIVRLNWSVPVVSFFLCIRLPAGRGISLTERSLSSPDVSTNNNLHCMMRKKEERTKSRKLGQFTVTLRCLSAPGLSFSNGLLLTVERDTPVEGRMDRLNFRRYAMVLGLNCMSCSVLG